MKITAVSGSAKTQYLFEQEHSIGDIYDQDCGTYSTTYEPNLSFLRAFS